MNNDPLHAPVLMPSLLIHGLNQRNDEPFMVIGDQEISYRQTRDTISQMVQALTKQGLGVGSRIAILSTNRPEVLPIIATIQLLGAAGTPLHPLGSKDDHAYVLNTAEIDTLIFDPTGFDEHAAALKEAVPGLKHLFSIGPSANGINYLELIEQETPAPLVAPEVDPDNLSSINFTGGTSGKPKGVMSTYRSTAYLNMMQMADWEFPEAMRMLVAAPLSHAAAAYIIPVLQRGGTFYVMPHFDPNLFYDFVEKYRITSTMVVPVMLYYLLDSPRVESADMSSMETIFYGASPMNPSRLEEAIKRWGPIFSQFYGQSEAPMAVASLRKGDHDLSKPHRLLSCGRPSPWVHLTLRDADNNPVASGEAGEICVRSPLVMKGYYNLPEATEETLAGGWLHTGDVGRFDEEGFLYIVDRTKDMIVTGGFNVYPREIEDVLATHAAVQQVAVIGVPDDQWGEAVKALVVLTPGSEGNEALIAELKALVKQAKGSVHSPKSVEFIDAIPLTPVGKPDKKVLKAQYWQESDRAVG